MILFRNFREKRALKNINAKQLRCLFLSFFFFQKVRGLMTTPTQRRKQNNATYIEEAPTTNNLNTAAWKRLCISRHGARKPTDGHQLKLQPPWPHERRRERISETTN